MGDLQVTWHEYPLATVIEVSGQFKPGDKLEETTKRLESSLSSGGRKFVIKFNNAWVNSLGVGWLHIWNAKIEKVGGVLVVCGIRKTTCTPSIPKQPFAVVSGLKEAAEHLEMSEWSLRDRPE